MMDDINKNKFEIFTIEERHRLDREGKSYKEYKLTIAGFEAPYWSDSLEGIFKIIKEVMEGNLKP